MLNLIIKDYVIQKKTILFGFLVPILMSIFFSSGNPIGSGLYVFAPIMTIFLFVTTAATYDDKNKSGVILNSLPLKRNSIVISKYISAFALGTINIIYVILIGYIGKIVGPPMYGGAISSMDIVLVLAFTCIFCCVFFPFYFIFGAVKMQMFNLILFATPLVLVPLLGTRVAMYISENPNSIFVGLFNYFIKDASNLQRITLTLIVGLIITLISLMISIRIYDNKEF